MIAAMRSFTDDELRRLIGCAKQVIEPPRREMRLDRKMRRNDMTPEIGRWGSLI